MLEMVRDRRSFKTQKDAIDFLVGEGFDLNKSNFSRHTREGKVGKSVEGVFEAEALMAYARLHVKMVDSGKTLSREDMDRSKAKAQAELELVQEKARRERIKRQREEAKLIERSRVEIEIGARAGIMSSEYKSEIQKRGPEFVELAGGDPRKTGDLIRSLTNLFDDIATRYASMKNIEVVLGDES
jgi:hypothetical protein